MTFISVGAPKANYATEIILAGMFGVDPFHRPVFTPGGATLPFYFCWPKERGEHFRSAFAMTSDQLEPMNPEAAKGVAADKASALYCRDTVYHTGNGPSGWRTYGIIAAQRRIGGSVWVAVAGLNGPATAAAASLIKQVEADIPHADGNGHPKNSPVLWVPICADLRESKSDQDHGDNREFQQPMLLDKPRIWDPAKAKERRQKDDE